VHMVHDAATKRVAGAIAKMEGKVARRLRRDCSVRYQQVSILLSHESGVRR